MSKALPSWRAQSLGRVQLVCHPLTVAHQAPLSTGFPGKNTGVGGHFLLQGIVPTQGSNPRLLHWQVESLHCAARGSPPEGPLCKNSRDQHLAQCAPLPTPRSALWGRACHLVVASAHCRVSITGAKVPAHWGQLVF